MPKTRIVVGQGTASQVYQFTGQQGEWNTLAIGPEGLWGTLPGGHAMGQPAHLLTLPGQPVPKFSAPSGKTAEGMKSFLDVQTYQGNVQSLSQANQGTGTKKFPNTKVIGVAESGEYIKVQLQIGSDKLDLDVDQIVFATGIGPQSSPESVNIKVKGVPVDGLGFKQIEEGIDYLAHADKLGKLVVVYGGAATGAWVAAEVNDHLKDPGTTMWLWLTRSDFSKATLPGDRNHQILAIEKNQWKDAVIEEAEYIPQYGITPPSDGNSGWPTRPALQLSVKLGSTRGKLTVDQLIYCLGRNPAAEGGIASLLTESLKAKIHPVLDNDRLVSDGNGVLAWGTSNNKVLIVGSATYNFPDLANPKKTPRDAPMSKLPPNAQVGDGIAVTVSTIEALNGFMPVTGVGTKGEKWNININTSNRTQIAAEIARNTDLDAFTANLFVAMIIHMRSKNRFGLDTRSIQEGGKDHVNLILAQVKEFIGRMRGIDGFEKFRRDYDNVFTADATLNMFIDIMTSIQAWQDFWKRNGLEC